MPYDARELSYLLTELRRSFGGPGNRDDLWDRRRDARHRRAAPNIPRDLDILKSLDVDFQDVKPEKVVSRIKSRLGANSVDVNVRVRGAPTPTRIGTREKLRDWFAGAWEELDPLGVKDATVRDHQAGDGAGFFELELRPTFTPPARNPNVSDKEYDTMVEDARRGYGLPCSLSAPDPRSLYYLESQGRLKIVAKVVNVPLVDVAGAYTNEGFRLAYEVGANGGRVSKQKVALTGGEEAPTDTSWANWGRRVRFVRIADDANIYDCFFPMASSQDAGLSPFEFFQADDAASGSMPALEILATYPNPLGHPPFYWAPGRLVPHANPAIRVKPLAAEILDLAPYMNTIRSVRLVRGILEALSPTHYKPSAQEIANRDPQDKRQQKVDWKPGIQSLQGDLTAMPHPEMDHFDKLDAELTTEYKSEEQSVMAALQSGAVGAKTPAWSVMMMNEDENSLLIDALNFRANAISQVLLDVAKVCRDRGDPVYVLAHQNDPKQAVGGEHDEMIEATTEDLKTPFILDVRIHAETQSQRAASTEYWRLLHQEGTISDETYYENIGIEDRVAEQRRKDYEAIRKPMLAAGRLLGMEMARNELREVYGPLADEIIGAMEQMSVSSDPEVMASGDQTTGKFAGSPVPQTGKGPSSPGQGQPTQLPDHVSNRPSGLPAPGQAGRG